MPSPTRKCRIMKKTGCRDISGRHNPGNSRARGEPFGRAARAADLVAAGDRTFRRRCRLNNRQTTSCITLGNLFGLPFSSVMCHRHTPYPKRHLSSKIFAKSAVIYFLPLTKWFRLMFSASLILLFTACGDRDKNLAARQTFLRSRDSSGRFRPYERWRITR